MILLSINMMNVVKSRATVSSYFLLNFKQTNKSNSVPSIPTCMYYPFTIKFVAQLEYTYLMVFEAVLV